MAVLKPLYFGSDLSDLQKSAKLGDTSKWSAKALCMSSEKIFNEAIVQGDLGDEEKAYVFFYKYIECVQKINKNPEFKNDVKYFTSMYNIEKYSKKAIVTLDALTTSLETRYDEKNTADRLAKLDLGNIAINYGIDKDEPKDYLISHQKLYSLMNRKSTTFLILDTRPTADYNNSHIDVPNSLNVPEMLLRPGVTAASVGNTLKPEFRSQWDRRSTVDMLIICDWTSPDFLDNKPVTVLRDAITKWDLGVEYKNPPYLLEGGFLKFLYTYPLKTYQLNKPSTSKPVMPSLDLDISERLRAEISQCTGKGRGECEGREVPRSKTEPPFTIDGACSLFGKAASEADNTFTASKECVERGARSKKTLADIDHLDHLLKEKSVLEEAINLELGQLGKHKEHVESIIGAKSSEMKNLMLSAEKYKKENKRKMQEINQADQDMMDLERRLAEVRNTRNNLENGCQQNESWIVELNDEIHKLEGYMDRELEKAQVEGSSIESRILDLKRKLSEIDKVIDSGNAPRRVISVPQPEETTKSWIDFIDKEIIEKERDLECPVCLEIAACPIYMCSESHLICRNCRPKVKKCPECRVKYGVKPKIHRYAEKTAEELDRLRNQRMKILEQQSTPGWNSRASSWGGGVAPTPPGGENPALSPQVSTGHRCPDNNSGAWSKSIKGQLKPACGTIAGNQELFVGRLPHNCYEEDLVELFTKYGKVVSVMIRQTAGRGGFARRTGFGFVMFEDANSVDMALRDKPIMLYGSHRLNVEEKKAQKPRA